MRAFFSLRALANLANPALMLATTLFALSGIPSTAFAAMDEIGRAAPSTHRLKFIVDPELAADIGPAEAGRRLAQYVADVNTVFTRETVRSFSFDPAADLQLTAPANAPQCSYSGLVNGEVVVCVSKSIRGYSHGGLSTSWTFPQKGVAWNLNWIAIHDPLRLTRAPTPGAPESTEKDYLARQLKTLLHELEHVFGAGSGEYYNSVAVTDTTGVAPVTDLALASDSDRYWWSRQHWRLDPLLGTVFEQRRDPASNRVATLEMIRFTAGTKANIDTDWTDWPKLGSSKFMAGTAATQVRVTDRDTGAALPGAQVSVWRNPGPGKPLVMLATGVADASGRYQFDWDCGFSCFAVGKTTLLVKARSANRAPGATWFTIFDAFEQKAVHGQTMFTIDLPLGSPDTTAPTVSVAAPSMATVGQLTVIAPAVVDNASIVGVKVVSRDSIPICTFTAPPYTCSWTPSAPGVQTIRVIALDAAGNSAVASANVIVNAPSDIVPPAVALAVPPSVPVGVPARLSANASDNVGVAELKFVVDGRTACTLRAAPYVCAWTPKRPGAANIEVRAMDAAGNIASTSASMRIEGLRAEDL
ncbi:Ig-like domain-containing protein [Variovorax sp. 160MFSha2.1]|uniref:Ig-like domain-containing protein n=1 Tax=Variovorax sp. 160MFSha2.1 TaxID=3158367 RepID=UPI003AAB075B